MELADQPDRRKEQIAKLSRAQEWRAFEELIDEQVRAKQQALLRVCLTVRVGRRDPRGGVKATRGYLRGLKWVRTRGDRLAAQEAPTHG